MPGWPLTAYGAGVAVEICSIAVGGLEGERLLQMGFVSGQKLVIVRTVPVWVVEVSGVQVALGRVVVNMIRVRRWKENKGRRRS